MYVVYKHTTPSGKVYIGITGQKPEKRWQNGNGYKGNPHFYSAILKYGWENIKHEIIENGLTKQQACDLEIKLIDKYDARDPHKGYNIHIGGECGALGLHMSAETRRKISEANKRRHLSAETRQRISEANKGIHPSAEARRKMSESHKGVNHPNYGKHLSSETRQRISESNKGKHSGEIPWNKGKKCASPSLETRRKMSEALKGANNPNYGKHLSAETRQKISESLEGNIPPNRKAVICVETGISYSSCTEAANSIGRTQAAISKVLGGVTKTCGGYHWRYAEVSNEEQISCV